MDAVQTAIFRLGLDSKDYENSARRVEAASAKLADSFSKVESRADPAEAAARRLAQGILQVERAREAGQATSARADAALARLTTNYDAQVAAINRVRPGLAAAGTSYRSAGAMIQQAGFQVGDFAVQIASGTNPMRAFIQQGTQLISMFGPWGAVIGAAGAVVGALAAAFIDTSDAADDAMTRLDKMGKLMDQLADSGRRSADSIMAEARNLLAQAEASQKVVEANAAIQNQLRLQALQEQNVMGQTLGFGASPDTSSAEAAIARRIGSANDRALALATLAETGAFDDAHRRKGFNGPAAESDLFDFKGAAAKAIRDQEEASEKAARAAQRYADEVMRINDGWARASESQKDAAQKLVDSLDPVAASTRNLEKDQATLLIAMANGIQITGGYAAAMARLEQEADPLFKLNEAHEQTARSLELELKMIGLNAAERAPYLAQLQAENELRAKNLPLTDDAARAYIAEAKALATRKVEIDEQIKALDDARGVLTGFLDQTIDRIGAGLTEAFATGQIDMAKFGDIGRAVLSELIQLAIQLAVINPIKNWATGSNDNQTASGIFSLIQTGLSAYFGWGGGGTSSFNHSGGSGVGHPVMGAKGLAFAGSHLTAMAMGGLIDRPTIFPMANGGLAMGGEAGTEAIMPLQRDAQGRLGVTNSGRSGGGITINMGGIVINSDAGTPQENQDNAERNSRELRVQIKAAVREVLQDQRRPMALLDMDN